jgi:hypothetical protein
MGRKYTMENELERLTRLAGRLGRRLEYNLRAPRSAGEPEATTLPGEEWRVMFASYESALRTLAHGHSERIKRRLLERKASNQGMLTDEEYERDMRQLAAESVMEASDADLEAWLAARAAAKQGKATPRGQA